MPLKPAATLLTLLLLTARASASGVPLQTIDSLVKNSDIIVVGEIVDIQTVGKQLDTPWRLSPKITYVHKRATIEVLRAINTADAKPLKPEEIVIDYIDYDPSVGVFMSGMPFLPSVFIRDPPFRVGTFAVFPLRRETTTTQPADSIPLWRFVGEDGEGLILPAIKEPFNAKPPASAKDFLQREIASAFVHGSFASISDAQGYLIEVSLFDRELQKTICAMIEPEISDVERWVDITAASYCHLAGHGATHPTLQELIAGSPHDPGWILIPQFALQKAKPDKIEERILRSLILHQDPRPIVGISRTLSENYKDNPQLVELELAALAKASPGAVAVCSELTRGNPSHPLAAPATAAARKILTAPGKDVEWSITSATPFLIRSGSDEDFAYLLDRIKSAQKENPAVAQYFLYATCDAHDGPSLRKIDIFRLYVSLTTPLKPATTGFPGDARLCDVAGVYIQALSRENFGLKYDDPLESRNLALEKIRTWLKANPDPVIPATVPSTSPASARALPPLTPLK